MFLVSLLTETKLNIVKPLNNGHLESVDFVRYSDVSEVKTDKFVGVGD